MCKDFFEDAFRGYEVPEKIKNISMAICERFVISGICDPIYICNVIAAENGIGDGMSHFYGDDIITNPYKTAVRLEGSYGCNITKAEIPEIEFCLMNGYFEKESAIAGLKLFSERTKKELKSCDEWRKRYLKRVLNQINEAINQYMTS